MKFNFDLSANPYSTRYMLTDDEIFAFSRMFIDIAEAVDDIPEDVFNDMSDIQKQFELDHRLSDKQRKYVGNIHDKYCT